MPLMAASGNQTDIREDDKSPKAILVTTKWLIKTSTVTIDVRGYSDEIYACVSWPKRFDADKDIVCLQFTAHDPHFTLGTINIEGTECETTDFVWHTLMNTVRWWCKSNEWVHINFQPDDDFSIGPAGKLRVCKLVSSPPVRLLGRTDAAGGQVHEEGGLPRHPAHGLHGQLSGPPLLIGDCR